MYGRKSRLIQMEGKRSIQAEIYTGVHYEVTQGMYRLVR